MSSRLLGAGGGVALHHVELVHAAAVGQRRAAAPQPARLRAVGEALAGVHGDRRLGVLGRAEVRPDALAALAPEALLGVLEQQRRVELAAAALAEDPADQARGGDHVRDLPVLRPGPPDRGVLARHLERVHARLLDVAVDPGHVVGHVLLEPGAGGAVDVVAQVELALEVGLGVRRDLPLRVVLRPVAGRAARERGQLRPPGVAQGVHHEQPVLGAHVAEPEHRARARGAVDVRHAEVAVAHDRHVVTAGRRVDPLRLVLLHAEGGVLEVLGDVGGAQPGGGVDEVAVHLKLLGGVLRTRRVRAVRLGRRAGGEECRDVGAACMAVLSRRQDVPEAAAVVGSEGLDGRVGGQPGQAGQLRQSRHLRRGAAGGADRDCTRGDERQRALPPKASHGAAKYAPAARAVRRLRGRFVYARTGTASEAIASISSEARSNSSSESTGVPSKGRSRYSSSHERQPWYSGRTFTVTGRGMR